MFTLYCLRKAKHMHGFKDYYTYNFLKWASSFVMVLFSVLFSIFGKGRLSLAISIILGVGAFVVQATCLILERTNRDFRMTSESIERSSGNNSNIIIISKVLSNISKLTGVDATQAFEDNGYLISRTPICKGDMEIENFIAYISKSISPRFSFVVHPVGFDRYISIEYTELHSNLLVCITNLEFGQAISFRPLAKAQRLGIQQKEELSGEFEVTFRNPISHIENVNAFIMCSLLGVILVVVNKVLDYTTLRVLGFGCVGLLVVYFHNKFKIDRLTKIPKKVFANTNELDDTRRQLKNVLINSIISRYQLSEEEVSIKEIFRVHGFVYVENKIWCKNDEESLEVVEWLSSCISGTLKEKYYINSKTLAYVINSSNRDIVITFDRLDDTQIIRIA